MQEQNHFTHLDKQFLKIDNLTGYVVYCKDLKSDKPFGVISNSHEIKALSSYIPEKAKQYLIEIEDKRFYYHKGIDLRAISRAIYENIKAGSLAQGGSTISQQLARNLLRDNRKTILRKIQEALFAISLERANTKEEILNLYLDNVYFGRNIWGLRAATLSYFGKEIQSLSQQQILYLITIIRGPNLYLKRFDLTAKRYSRINEILLERNILTKNKFRKNMHCEFAFNRIELQNIHQKAIPYIIYHIDNAKKQIHSTLESKFQNFARQFVSNSKYPVSIIILKKTKIIGLASSYGTDYPFVSKSNVGSTLKPFLYVYLRSQGILKEEKFHSRTNSLNWNVREIDIDRSGAEIMNLQEALYCSNNNTFINAASKVGIDNTLVFLAKILNKPISDFFPSTILGASKGGISLYELAMAYATFFGDSNVNEFKIECLQSLNKIFFEKMGFSIKNAFLKTGTTNENKERYVILGNAELTFAFLRNENPLNDNTKDGNFLAQISKSLKNIFTTRKKNYKWT
ncbi:MAG: transglycosylase domain-containing protein [Chitinophagaceae bacterium]